MHEQRPETTRPERRSAWLEKQASVQDDIIVVLRTAQQHHVMLGMIADQKANIVLGAFLIFITVTQSMLEKHGEYSTSIWLLSAFFAISAIFALLVITPRFRSLNPKSARPSNLLFFGSFTALDEESYIKSLNEKLHDNEQARLMIMKDIYQIGKVLDKKYRNLKLSYLCLGIGIFASTISITVQESHLL